MNGNGETFFPLLPDIIKLLPLWDVCSPQPFILEHPQFVETRNWWRVFLLNPAAVFLTSDSDGNQKEYPDAAVWNLYIETE